MPRQQTSVGREGWLLDEDRALRDLLDNITVHDNKAPNRKVGVWFGHPDQELRAQKFPYLTIDLLDISVETDRAERGFYQWPTYKNMSSGLSAEPYNTDSETPATVYLHHPLPLRLTYQVSSWARNPRHDRQIISSIMSKGLIRPQGASIDVSDGTSRRLDMLEYLKRDTVEEDRRLLVNTWILGMSSEVLWSKLLTTARVNMVVLNFVLNQSDGSITVDEDLTIEPPAE